MARRLSFRLQLLVALCILVGLFFIEYPPIFLFGYWSWGAFAHKTLSGLLIALNLLVTQRATRRLGFFRTPEAPGSAEGGEGSPGLEGRP